MDDVARLAIAAADWDQHGRAGTFSFSHALSDEPLLVLDALADLADRLRPDQIETTDARSPLVVEKRTTRRLTDADTRRELVRSAEDEKRWISMRNIETDPVYAELVQSCFAEFKTMVGLGDRDVFGPEGYLFISAEGGVTPAHVDHEMNLFFQIAGAKRFHTGRFPDEATRDQTLEGMYDDQYGSTPFEPADVTSTDLAPGDGLYLSPQIVHMVENTTSGLAISFSLVFQSTELVREARVYALNGHLRRLGLSPRPPGSSDRVDMLKARAVGGWRRAKSALTSATGGRG